MMIIPAWARSLGAAGAATNAATACARLRAEEDALEGRLQAFHEDEHDRLAAARSSQGTPTARSAHPAEPVAARPTNYLRSRSSPVSQDQHCLRSPAAK